MALSKGLLCSAVLLTFGFSAVYAENITVNRYALFVGANNGGESYEELRYAVTDAQSIAGTFQELGGIAPENSTLLSNPTLNELQNSFQVIAEKIRYENNIKTEKQKKMKLPSTQSEFIFYYSGHSENDGILLGNEKLKYNELNQIINSMPGDVHLIILDSCYSGNIVRSKGGKKRQPFITGETTTGTVYMLSSSGTEQSQESDDIHASYFTSSLVTGMRGAADTSGDNLVSLKELFNYAYSNTTTATAKNRYGSTQHPEYEVSLEGNSNVTLTNINRAESLFLLPQDVTGRILFRNQDNSISGEIIKKKGTNIRFALPAGSYMATIKYKKKSQDAYFVLNEGNSYTLRPDGRLYITEQTFHFGENYMSGVY